MKKVDTWPYAFRVTCAHNGIGRPYAEPTTYEIEPGDLRRGVNDEIGVTCPDCGQELLLTLMVRFGNQEQARMIAEIAYATQEARS